MKNPIITKQLKEAVLQDFLENQLNSEAYSAAQIKEAQQIEGVENHLKIQSGTDAYLTAMIKGAENAIDEQEAFLEQLNPESYVDELLKKS
jgi:dTDP-4-amino-4,6-dideoxygalactose transaminase